MTTLIDRIPTVDELGQVAEAVGWLDHFDWDTIGDALDRSLHGVIAVDHDGVVLGIGRLVGDGARYCTVQDVMVRPEAAEGGVATRIVERLLHWVREQPSSAKVVGLFASPEAVGLYASLGFQHADGDPQGMTMQIG